MKFLGKPTIVEKKAKVLQRITDKEVQLIKTCKRILEGGSLMGDKHDSKNKHGKKLTTKEKKAQNHLKLMQGAKDRQGVTSTEANNNFNKDKKAA